MILIVKSSAFLFWFNTWHFATHSHFLFLFILWNYFKSCKIQCRQYILHSAPLNNNILHNHDALIKIKKLTFVHYHQLTCRLVPDLTSFSTDILSVRDLIQDLTVPWVRPFLSSLRSVTLSPIFLVSLTFDTWENTGQYSVECLSTWFLMTKVIHFAKNVREVKCPFPHTISIKGYMISK